MVSVLWYRLSRHREKRHFKIQEVSLEMHDDKSRDRIYVTQDHALVIAASKLRDAGSYFCRTPEEEDDVIEKTVPERDIAKLLKNPKVRFFYHLDVLEPSQEEAVLVALTGSDESLPTPSPPIDMSKLNIHVFTDWQAWSSCSVCDSPDGTRRRVGQCRVQKMNSSQSTSPVFLDAVLSSYGRGVPCRSSLLRGHGSLRHLVSRPDEVIQEDCSMTCAVHHAQLVLSASGFLGSAHFYPNGEHAVRQKHFREPEGDHVTLKCQKTTVSTAVAWVNGSNVLLPTQLHHTTGGRVWVDEHNSLHMHPVLPWDSSSYVCLVLGQVKGFIRLKVIAKPAECKVCRYAIYLAMTFPMNFLVYCFIVYAKNKERKRVLNYNLLNVHSSSTNSTSSSDTEESSSTDDEN